jgi:WD40 repeat protein
LHSLATVSLFVVAVAACYIPFDRWRASQRWHVTVLECNLPANDATLISLVRVNSDQMQSAAESRLTLIDLHNQRRTQEIAWSNASPACIAVSHDQRRLFVGTTTGEIYSLDRENCGGERQFIGRHSEAAAEDLAVSADNRILISRGFRSLHAWNLERASATWKRLDLDCNAYAICSSSTLVCGTNTGEILELSLATGKTVRLLARHKTNIRHIAAAANMLVTVDGAGEAILFCRQSDMWVRRPAGKLFSGNSRLNLSANGKLAVGTNHNNTQLVCWALDGQEPICHMTGHKGIIINASFLPDGSILSCGNDGTVRIWDLAAHGALRLVTRISPLFAG